MALVQRPRLLALAATLGGLAACQGNQDIAITDQRFPPSCEVVWPADDGQILFGAGFELAVSISDADTPPEELSFRAVSDIDGILPGEPVLDEIGATLDVGGTLLREGYHTITVTVSDETEVSECEASFFIVPNTDPSVNFAGPDSDGVYLSSENILVDITAFDADEVDQAVLVLEWNGIGADQPTAAEHPDGDGISQWFLPLLPAGNYTLGVRAVDPVGGSRTSSVAFTVIPTDGDGDGWISAGDGGADCNDGDFAINPAQLEICNGVDDDCDGQVDEDDAFEAPSWWTDGDIDGFGDPDTRIVQCIQPVGYIAFGGDCDDADDAINPNADEVCDDIDNDCDGAVDDEPIDGLTFFLDLDGDTFGDPTAPTTSCVPGPGVSTDATDCNDSEATANPVSDEQCGNSVDDDCDGAVDEECFFDHCGVIDIAETWTADATHRVTCPVVVQSTLTILDGVDVEFSGPNARIEVARNEPGRMVIQGTARDGVEFRAGGSVPTGALLFYENDTGSELRGFTFRDVDDGRNAIWTRAPSLLVENCALSDGPGNGILALDGAEITVHDCTIDRFVTNGIQLDDARLVALTDTTFDGNIGAPLYIDADDVGSIGAGNSFTGNWIDAIEVRGGFVEQDATWSPQDVPYNVAGSLRVGGVDDPTLTLEPGVVMGFRPAANLYVGDQRPGKLVIDAASNPVILQSRFAVPSPGDWDGLTFEDFDTGSSINGVIIRDGYYGVWVRGSDARLAPTVPLQNVTIENALQEGIFIEAFGSASVVNTRIEGGRDHAIRVDGELTQWSGNTVENNTGTVMILPPSQLGALDGTSTYASNGDERIFISGNVLIDSDFTWPFESIPFRMPWYDIRVNDLSSPTLTLPDGLEIQFGGSCSLDVGNGYMQTEPGPNGVLFTSDNVTPARGDWGGVHFREEANMGPNGIEGLTVEYAGQLWTETAVSFDRPDIGEIRGLTVRYSGEHGLRLDGIAHATAIVDSTFEHNEQAGLRLRHDATVDLISNNTFTSNDSALRMDNSTNVDAVMADNLYSGNFEPGVHVNGIYDWPELFHDVTMRKLSVPWMVHGTVRIQGTIAPVWTIEPGVELYFDDRAGIVVGYDNEGTLHANGTAAEPIVLTSAQAAPAPGDWHRLRIGEFAHGELIHTVVEYGGNINDTTNTGTVAMDLDADFAFLDVQLRHSAAYGLFGYNSAQPLRPDLSTVSFTDNVAGDTNW